MKILIERDTRLTRGQFEELPQEMRIQMMRNRYVVRLGFDEKDKQVYPGTPIALAANRLRRASTTFTSNLFERLKECAGLVYVSEWVEERISIYLEKEEDAEIFASLMNVDIEIESLKEVLESI